MVTEPTLVSDFEDEGDMVRLVSCGARHTAAVTSDDCLFVWGNNTFVHWVQNETVQEKVK